MGEQMPINIPADLPARVALEKENIFVITDEQAVAQDIRPLNIAIVNLMPTKIATETQFLRLLGNTPIQVNISFLRPENHVSKNTPPQHLERFYKTLAEVEDKKFDGLIVTGAPVEHLDFEEVDYWRELQTILAYADEHVFSTLYICWAAQAALYHFYGLQKYPLKQKISGIFEHKTCYDSCSLFRGFDDSFYMPHSRHTEIKKEDIEQVKELCILAESEAAGAAIIESRDASKIFITGHLEYDRDTLDIEYRRDINRGLQPAVPKNYYPNDDPAKMPLMPWRAHANLFFINWLNYYVYQEAPFDWDKQK